MGRDARRLENIGAAVESGAPGTRLVRRAGLNTLHGGSLEGVLAAARRALDEPVRLGAAPSRFAALAAASRARARKAEVAAVERGGAARLLAPLPVSLLRMRPETAALPDALERFGSPRSASWPRCRARRWPTASARSAVGARPGAAGATRRCARAPPSERLEEALELPESASGAQLERGLGLLIDRLLARHERRGRALRAVVLAAKLVEGGTWRARVTFREALADPRRMRLVLVQRLAELPAPAEALRLRAEGFGPPAGDQRSLLAEPAAVRAAPAARGGPPGALGRRPGGGAADPRPSTPTRACPSAASRLTPWEP